LPDTLHYHASLSNYFSAQPLFFDSDLQKKPNIRKCVELPFQQTKAELWNEVTETLCNLDFIQAKACAKLTYDLVGDFNEVLEVIPDNAENISKEKARQERMAKYTYDLIAFAKGEITVLDIPESITPWPQEKIEAEIERIITNPTRLDRLKDFLFFLGQEGDNLQNYCNEIPNFTIQQAWNYTNNGSVGSEVNKLIKERNNTLLLYGEIDRLSYNPLPIIDKVQIKNNAETSFVSFSNDGTNAFTLSHSYHSHDEIDLFTWNFKTGQSYEALPLLKTDEFPVKIVGHGQYVITHGKILHYGNNWKPIGRDKSFLNLSSGKLIKKFDNKFTSEEILDVSYDGKKMISLTKLDDQYCTIKTWNLSNDEIICEYKWNNAGRNKLTAVKLTIEGNHALLVSFDGTVRYYNINNWEILKTLRLSEQFNDLRYENSVCITPDSKYVFAGYSSGNCIMWDLENERIIRNLGEHKGDIVAVCITPDARFAISTGYATDFSCNLWNINSGQIIKRLIGHFKLVKCIQITPDAKYALSGSSDQRCILWNLESGQETRIIKKTPHKGNIHFCLTPDRKQVLTNSTDGKLIFFNLKNFKISEIHDGYNYHGFFTPDSTRLVSHYSGRNYQVIDLEDWSTHKSPEVHTNQICGICNTPDGKYIITSSMDSTCIIYDLLINEPIKILKGQKGTIKAVKTTPDGKLLISSSLDDTIYIWNIKTGECIKILNNDRLIKNTANVLEVSPNGKQVVIGSMHGTCIIWEIKSGKMKNIFNVHNKAIGILRTTADYENVISISGGNVCSVWKLEPSKRIAVFIFKTTIGSLELLKDSILVGCQNNIEILNVSKDILCLKNAITTVRHIWDFKNSKFKSFTSDCPLCGHRFTPSTSIMATIESITKKVGLKPEQSPCLELPDEAWEEPGLLGNCPKCGAELKFNPFIAGGDY
jgi:WD40 repeat protein